MWSGRYLWQDSWSHCSQLYTYPFISHFSNFLNFPLRICCWRTVLFSFNLGKAKCVIPSSGYGLSLLRPSPPPPPPPTPILLCATANPWFFHSANYCILCNFYRRVPYSVLMGAPFFLLTRSEYSTSHLLPVTRSPEPYRVQITFPFKNHKLFKLYCYNIWDNGGSGWRQKPSRCVGSVGDVGGGLYTAYHGQ